MNRTPFKPAILAALIAQMLASQSQAADTVELDAQRVTGQLFSQNIAEQAFAVEVIERADLKSLPVTNLADALEWVGGLDVRQRGSGAQVDLGIRGAGYEQTLILVDGVRMNDPQTGHHNFDLPVTLEDIERIEIVRGPGAGQYGPNGNAGVINLVTRKQVESENGRSALLKAEAGSKDYARGLLSLAKTQGNWSHFAAVSQQESDTYIKGADLDYISQQGNYRLVHQNNAHTTVLGLGYLDRDFGTQGFYTPPNLRTNESTIQRHAYLTHEQRYSAGRSVDVAVNWRQHDDEFYYLNYAPSVHQTNALQSRLRFRLNESLALGYEFNQEDIDSTSTQGDRHEREYSSAFAFGQYDFGAVQLAGSLSYLDYDGGDSYTLPVLGLTLTLAAGQQLYLNAGKSVRVPTMNDLYLYQINPVTNTGNQGNADLKAEETSSAELGARLNLAGLQTRLAVFKRNTSDAIDYTQTAAEVADPAINYYTARNIDAIDTKGYDIELDATGLLAASGLQKASLSYTRLVQEFTNQYEKALYSKSQFEHQVVLALAYELLPGLSATSLYKFEDRYNQNGYRIWDLGLKQQNNGWSWAVAATNVLDADYIDSGFIEAPGTGYRFEISAGL
ncbi:TonB-dependent receptor [Thalassolituus sp. ST750PaO-4]|uniref:TonB-dependent receptor plug domain-containing protein n=1 Tax=Thalassolituus sp. ST750PaO-4 TaxID=2742965 RepID=UPI001CE27B83|nr:TonB-dependent receptor [Thalassolituus sp. ST750PaO-4]MCA6061049.1 TonB-dependent receptor [Thalassolituus sp. ST750PaO-4]